MSNTGVRWLTLGSIGLWAAMSVSSLGCGGTTGGGQADASAGGIAGSGGVVTGGTTATAGAANGGGGTGATSGGGEGASGGTPAGGTGGMPSGGTGGTTGPVLCASDKPCTPLGQLCDTTEHVCVECRNDQDCTGNTLCRAGNCVHFLPCVNSRDCSTDQVCDEAAGLCVQCVGNLDCPSTAVCARSVCRTQCVSDKDCTPSGQLCDETAGYCVTCTKDADCGASLHCDLAVCVRDVCSPDSTACVGTQLFTCNSRGSGYTTADCPNGCTAATSGAHCTGFCEGGAGGASGDSVTVPSCGQPGATTQNPYAGTLSVTVQGIITGAPGALADPFYVLNANDTTQSTATCPACLVYNHAAEGQCVCPTECPSTSHRVSDILVGAYPAFNPTHVYNVQLALTGSADQLNFAFGDCGCYDNSGSYSLTVWTACP